MAIITLFLDIIKGVVMLLIAMAFNMNESVLWTIAVLAVMGHCFSIFLNFEGGKGVATAIGVLAVMMPYSAIIAVIIWGFVSKGLKISSLSSIIALIGFLISSYIIYPNVDGIASHSPIWIISIIVFYKHTPNIIRLFNGEEKSI